MRTLGSVLLRREVSAVESLLSTRVVRRVDRSVRESLEAGSVIERSVCRYCKKDGLVNVKEQWEAESGVMWEEGEGESGVIWDGDNCCVVDVGVDGGNTE